MKTLLIALLIAAPTPSPGPLPYPFNQAPPERTPCIWLGQWECPPGFTAPDWPKER